MRGVWPNIALGKLIQQSLVTYGLPQPMALRGLVVGWLSRFLLPTPALRGWGWVLMPPLRYQYE